MHSKHPHHHPAAIEQMPRERLSRLSRLQAAPWFRCRYIHTHTHTHTQQCKCLHWPSCQCNPWTLCLSHTNPAVHGCARLQPQYTALCYKIKTNAEECQQDQLYIHLHYRVGRTEASIQISTVLLWKILYWKRRLNQPLHAHICHANKYCCTIVLITITNVCMRS